MEGQRDESGRYLPEVRQAVIDEVRRSGVWAAVERHGVAYGTVTYWWAQERKRERALGEAVERETLVPAVAPAPTPGEAELTLWRVHTSEEKAAALRDLETMGVLDTALKHGVLPQTIRNWRTKSERDSAAAEPRASEAQEECESGRLREVPLDPEVWRDMTTKREAVAKRYTRSEQAGAVGEAVEMGVAQAARRLGATRHSLYRWLRRTQREAGVPVERKWEQTEVEKQRDLEILHEWHKQPGLGPMQIRSQLRRRGIRTSVHTVRRVMEDNGYRPPKVESQAHHERYEALRPNQLWHLDFVHRHIHLAGTFTLILLDDHSRYVVGHAVEDAERADTVIAAFEESVARHGRPEAVMTDRGAAFWAWRGIGRFSRLLEEMGVDQYVAEDKELNGKVEIFNANIAKELFDRQRFDDVGQMRTALARHLDWYNHQRTHQALGGLLVPADRYYGRAQEVMARLEAGEGLAGEVHDPGLEARLLTLFQVVSRHGKPEVWLLGNRIL